MTNTAKTVTRAIAAFSTARTYPPATGSKPGGGVEPLQAARESEMIAGMGADPASGSILDRRRLGLAIASNYGVLAAQVGFVGITTPVVISGAGIDTFGAWTIVLAVRGYLALLDHTLSPATARFVAAADDGLGRRAAISAGLAALAGAGILALVAGLAAAALVPGLVEGAPGLGPALALIAIATAIQLPLNGFAAGLFGLQRIWERNAFAIARYVLSAVALVAAVGLDAGLAGFVATALAAETVVIAAQAGYCLLRVVDLRPRAAGFNRSRLADLLGFSVPLLGLELASQLAFATGPLIVGGALGAAAVAVYGVGLRIAEGIARLLVRFAEVFLPVFAALEAAGKRAEARRVFTRGTRATIAVGFPLLGTAVGLGGPLIALWVGDGFDDSWTPLALLCVAIGARAPLQFGVLWAIGAARHRRLAALSLAAGATAALAGAALVGPLELDGVALAVAAGLAPFDLWLIPRAICGEIGLSPWRDYLRPLLTATAAVAPLVVFERLVLAPAVEGSGPALVACAVAAVLASAAAVRLVQR
jgi:membrane protein EpsK